MISNQVIETILDHRSVRRYTSQEVDDATLETIVRAGQQAPFAYQMYSIILSRDRKKNAFRAPLSFTICVDVHKLERIMQKRGWKTGTNDLTLVLFGLEDASYMAQNMVIAARSLGLGSCFIGYPLAKVEPLATTLRLPPRVFPVVQLVMGYPDEDFPPRPRYPLDFTLFEDTYPVLTDEMVERAMKQMDDGYLAQDYYRKLDAKLPLQDREESFSYKDYSWTEHISRKAGQYSRSLEEQRAQLALRGFNV